MANFDRITHDPNHMVGQACIRGLPITVSDVVRPLASGEKSVADVLALYPALELEDVHQALAWAVTDVVATIGYFSYTLKYNLPAIQTYNYILGTPEIQDRIEDYNQDTFRQKVKDAVNNIRLNFYYLQDWVSTNYEPFLRRDKTDLKGLMSKINKEIQQTYPNIQIDLSLTNHLPLIFVDPDRMERAISAFIANESYGQYLSGQVVVKADFVKNSKVKVEITHFSTGANFDLGGYTPLSIAYQIIKLHGSEVKMFILEEMTSFEFDLPIWKEDSDAKSE